MADAIKTVFGPAFVTTSFAPVYTVPAATTAVVRDIFLRNTSSNDQVFAATISALGMTLSALNVPPQGILEWSGFLPMTAGEVLNIYTNTSATRLIAIITVVEVT